MNARPYQGAADLLRLQHFNAVQIAANPFGWLQPGDIPHRLYNGYREHDPARLLHIWEDDADEIIGWAFAYPDDAFDIQSRDPNVIRAALTWIEATLTADVIETDLWRGGDPRREGYWSRTLPRWLMNCHTMSRHARCTIRCRK